MTPVTRRIAPLLLLASLSGPPAIAFATPQIQLQAATRPAPRRLLPAGEIRQSVQLGSVRDMVARLRPEWLGPRYRSARVYLDGVNVGGPEALRQLSAHTVVSMELVSGIQATQRFGTNHGSGAIMIQTGPRG